MNDIIYNGLRAIKYNDSPLIARYLRNISLVSYVIQMYFSTCKTALKIIGISANYMRKERHPVMTAMRVKERKKIFKLSSLKI